MSATNANERSACYHNSPHEDENPEFFEELIIEDFGEDLMYQCKHCEYVYFCEWTTEEGRIFERKYNELQKTKKLLEETTCKLNPN